MPVSLIDKDCQSRSSPAHQLVVVLHGWMYTSKRMAGIARLIQQHMPAADIYMPDTPLRRWNATDPAEEIVAELVRRIDQRVNDRRYESIVLLGHSSGGVLARKIFLAAWGAAEDVDPSRRCYDWAPKIERIVFIAAVNRGWTVTSATSYINSVLWQAGIVIGRLFYGGRPTILQTRRGSRFLVNTRLQWLALMNDASKPAGSVVVIQLLGTVDDLISPADAIDHVADFRDEAASASDPASRRFFLVEMPHTGHFDAVDVDPADDPASARIRLYRRAIIARALTGTADKLARHPRAVRRELLDDDLPPAPLRNVRDVVFVIHGIRDRGFWTKKVARKIREHATEPDNVRCVTATYGYFPMAPFILKWGRQDKVEWLMDLYCEVKARYPEAALSYVGHSNGTYLLAKALEDYPATRFKHVVFAGSVVRRDFPWRQFRHDSDPPRVQRLLNYVATNDWVVAIFPKGLQRFRWFDLGGAGHEGFENLHGDGLHQVEYVKGTHKAGLRESQWDDIARFVLSGDAPDQSNIDYVREQSRWLKGVGRTSTGVVLALLAIIVAITLAPIVLLVFQAGGDWWGVLMTALFVAWCLLLWLILTRV